jgi:hypothetical protein
MAVGRSLRYLPCLLIALASSVTFAASETCPFQNSNQFQAFLRTQADLIVKKIEGPSSAEMNSLIATLQVCAGPLAQLSLSPEFERIASYAKAATHSGAMFDAGKSSELYISNLPAYASKPHSFFLEYPFSEWPKRLKDAGWPLIEKHEFADDPRTFTWIEEGRFLKFYLFSQSILASITVEKTDENGTKLSKPRIHFVEYPFSEVPVKKLELSKASISMCAACHPSGPRMMVPLPGEVLPSQWTWVDQMNTKIRAMGTNFDWNDGYHAPSVGPLLGEKQGCTDCHDGIERGVLNYVPYGGASGASITYKLTSEWRMPPWPRSLSVLLDRVSRLDGVSEEGVVQFREKFLNSGESRSQKLRAGILAMGEVGKLTKDEVATISKYLEEVVMPRNGEVQKTIRVDYAESMKNWLLNH